MKETHCKSCFHSIDSNMGVQNDSQPEEGDYSICAYCGKISMFDGELNLIALTQEQVKELEKYDLLNHRILIRAAELIKERINNN